MKAETLWRQKFEYRRDVMALIFFDADTLYAKGNVFAITLKEFRNIFTEE